MVKILLIGSLSSEHQDAREFVQCLGEQVIEQGHILLTGCHNEFDRVVAESAFAVVTQKGLDPSERIVSYVAVGSKLVHNYGTILKSKLKRWGIEHKGLEPPEQIHLADVIIVIAGSKGAIQAANWARITKKPLLPITMFGGAAETIYEEELKNFEKKYAGSIEQFEYEKLNQISSDWKKIATDTIALSQKIIQSKYVFVIMSFSKDPKLEDAYESFKDVCESYAYECIRIDDASAVDRIIPEIFSNIKKSAFVIADLSEEKANVYYELGFAQGLNKPVIITAYKGTPLPFDVKDIPTIYWEGQKQLKSNLREKMKQLTK